MGGDVMDEVWVYNRLDIEVFSRSRHALGLWDAQIREVRRIVRKSLNPYSDIDFCEQERVRRAGRQLSPLVDWRRERVLGGKHG